jgi:drug/metabolite transporter (DMT)-like permease
LTLLEPLVAVMMVGVLIFGESIHVLGAMGGTLILTGAALVLSRGQSSNIDNRGSIASKTSALETIDQ